MSQDDRRLIEGYLSIEAISKEASRKKSARKGHSSKLHLWWARREHAGNGQATRTGRFWGNLRLAERLPTTPAVG